MQSGYSGLLSLVAHCSKIVKKKKLFNHFPSHPLPFSCLSLLVFPHFFFLVHSFSHAYTSTSASTLFFFSSFSLNPSRSSLPSTHATKPTSASLLLLTEPPSQTQPLLPPSEPIPKPLFSPWCAPTILWVWVYGSEFMGPWVGGDWGGLLWLRRGSLGLMGFACRGRRGS